MRVKIFSKFLNYLYGQLHKPVAMYWLMLLSFAEACVLPLPPVLLLIPMCLQNTARRWLYINVASVMALGGSVLGYVLGSNLLQILVPWLDKLGYMHHLVLIQTWLQCWGLVLFLPMSILPFPPFKLFTIAAGMGHLPFAGFMVMAFTARWLHFYSYQLLSQLGRYKLTSWQRAFGI